MTLNIDLEDVPFAILEAVKARILLNRRRLQQGQEQQGPRPSLRPRPQFVKIGANSKTWRLPKTAAMPLDDVGGYLLGPNVSAYINGVIPVQSTDLPQFSFSRHDIVGQWIEDLYVRDFAIIPGPIEGTYALTRLNDVEPSINYLYASNFAPSVGVDLNSIMDLNGALQFDPISRGNALLEVEPLIYPSPLNDARARVGNYRSHTFEFMIKVAPLPSYVMFNGFAFTLTNIGYTNLVLQVQRLTGIASNPTGDPNHYDSTTKEFSAYLYAGTGTAPPGFLQINPLTSGQWVHVALSKSESQLSLYINGNRIIQAETLPNYWELYAGFDAFSGSRQEFSVINGEMPLMCFVSLPSGSPGDVAIHGIRFTPRALYSGSLINPPTSITQLA